MTGYVFQIIHHHDSNLRFMINIYGRLSGAVSLLWINKTSKLKSQLMWYKSKAEQGKIPPRWIKRIQLEMCNLSAVRLTVWFIGLKLFAPPTSIVCFTYWRKWICLTWEWMSSGTMTATRALQWSECRLLSLSLCLSHTHTLTQNGEVLLYCPILQSVLACVGSIFSNPHAHTAVCVSNAMCQDGIMLRIQSDGP